MKKFLLITFLLFLLYAPFLTIKPIKNYYKAYEDIAKKYECYPIENCLADFNKDGKNDTFLTNNEPTQIERVNYRLKVLVDSDGKEKEILNVNYDHTDNTLRTHVAVFEEDGKKKLIIYDTVNTEQFFFWDGNRLSPTPERTFLEREIWKAMSLEDDTGGFNQKIALDLTLIPLFGLYYIILLASIGIFIYFKKISNAHFFQ